MLIGTAPRRPNIQKVRRIKKALREALRPVDTIEAKDLVQVCTAWGFDVKISELASQLQEN